MGPRTQVVCDAHDLPFKDGAFDAVVCQAVLPYVLDPARVVDEIHRVLRPGGLVYSEAAFMQQVHAGAGDFTRFTAVGHRRLYRSFDEIASGAQGGPGMALAWSIRYFVVSFARSSVARGLLSRIVTLGVFWLKYLDAFLLRRPAGLDAAAGTYFLGRRRDTPVSDAEILAAYRGAGARRASS
jgi:SAM-dependent methyltransferase